MPGPFRCLILTVVGLVGAPVQGASPYPPGSLLTGITWDAASYRPAGNGTAGCAQQAAHGVGLTSEQPAMTTLHCSPGPTGKDRLMALLASGDGLFARLAVRDLPQWLALYRRRGYRPVWEAFKRDVTLGIQLHKTGMAKNLQPYRPALR